jgi:ATP adenylyltransferase
MNAPHDWDRLWAPHRLPYLQGVEKDAGCVFCINDGRDNKDELVVHRSELAFVIMNLYPYNSGHLLVCPFRHVADLTELSAEESSDMQYLTKQAMQVIRKVSGAQGFNLGMNQGSVSGAGIADHLHQHIVPRWQGDTNFMPIIGSTKVLAQLLKDLRDLLAQAWPDAR